MDTDLRDRTLARLREADSFAAIEMLQESGDDLAFLEACDALLRHCYWKERDLSAVITFARAGMQQGLAAARALEDSNPERAAEMRNSVRRLAYNLASYTWTGWDEPGIALGATDRAFGLDAARLYVRLGVENAVPSQGRARGSWILGAQLLAANQPQEAALQFEESARHADAADRPAEVLLGSAFALVATLCSHPDDAEARTQLEATLQQLPTVPDGAGFTGQIRTALRVFAPTVPIAAETK